MILRYTNSFGNRDQAIKISNQRIRKGKIFSGIESTLMKPHGFKSLMEDVLRYLEPSDKRRWDSF